MVETYVGKIVVDFCSFFDKSVEGLGFEDDKVPEVKIKGNNGIAKGFRNIVSAVSNNETQTPEESISQDQWVEYIAANAVFLQNPGNTSHILKELHEYLSDKVYFLGNKASPVDILLYLYIYDVMLSLTFQDKEKYMNVSRWFNNMQQNKKLKGGRHTVCFSRTRLYA